MGARQGSIVFEAGDNRRRLIMAGRGRGWAPDDVLGIDSVGAGVELWPLIGAEWWTPSNESLFATVLVVARNVILLSREDRVFANGTGCRVSQGQYSHRNWRRIWMYLGVFENILTQIILCVSVVEGHDYLSQFFFENWPHDRFHLFKWFSFIRI